MSELEKIFDEKTLKMIRAIERENARYLSLYPDLKNVLFSSPSE